MPRKKQPAPLSPAALNDDGPAPIEYQAKWKDPGTWISAERISDCIDRIFIDYSKRLSAARPLDDPRMAA